MIAWRNSCVPDPEVPEGRPPPRTGRRRRSGPGGGAGWTCALETPKSLSTGIRESVKARSGETLPQPVQQESPVRARDTRDFIAVDDSGDFSYHRSEQDLIAAFEYVAEAACIIDRSGRAYRLALDPNRHLILAQSLGQVDFHWLRQAWLDAQNAHPEAHRLRRFFPLSREEVGSALFETIAVEHGPEPAEGNWSLEMNGGASHPAHLEDVDHLFAHQDLTKHVRVNDPFGHTYRPLRHRRHWYPPESAGFNLYVEIPAPAASH